MCGKLNPLLNIRCESGRELFFLCGVALWVIERLSSSPQEAEGSTHPLMTVDIVSLFLSQSSHPHVITGDCPISASTQYKSVWMKITQQGCLLSLRKH